MDCRAESEVAYASWASRRVGSDSGSDRVAFGVAKPKPNEIVMRKKAERIEEQMLADSKVAL
jgi:hypothetical protein